MLKRAYQKIGSILMLIILSFLFFHVDEGINDNIIIFSLCIFYVYFIKCIIKPVQIVNNINTFLSIDFFFLLFTYLVFYHPYQMYLLGLYDLNYTEFPFDLYLNEVNQSLILTDMGLISFMLGFNTKKHNYTNRKKIEVNIHLLNNLTSFFIIMLLISVFVFIWTGGWTMFIGNYTGSDSGSITGNAIFNVINIFFTLSIINIIYTYWQFKKFPIKHILLTGVIVFWCILLLILGDRNTFFLIAIAAGGGIFTFIKSISRLKLLGFIFLGLLLYNIIEVTRNLENKNWESINQVIENDYKKNEKSTYGASTFNITLVTLRSSIYIISNKKDFYYGKLKLVSLTSIIPYSSRLFIDKNDSEYNSADILTDEMIGNHAGWNTGSNIFSDFYLDFGILGVIVGLFILGYYGGYIKNSLIRDPNNILYFYLYIIILSYYSEITRYGFDFPLRSIFWTIIIFNIIFINQLKKRI